MKKKDWKPVKRLESKYTTLIQKLLKPIEREALKHAKSPEKVAEIFEKALRSKTYKRKAKEIAETMATLIFQDGSRNWREAARKSSRGREINKMIQSELSGDVGKRFQELLDYNATLIETLPLDVAKDVIKHVESKTFTAERASDISKELKPFISEHIRAKSALISRTETSKISSALTQARSEDLGVPCYVWRTSEDARVRSSHDVMDGVIIFYNDPPVPEKLDKKFKGKKFPAPYHAGNIYNCRCYQEPLISFSDVRFPCRVFHNGKIQRMTLAEFKKIGGKEFE